MKLSIIAAIFLSACTCGEKNDCQVIATAKAANLLKTEGVEAKIYHLRLSEGSDHAVTVWTRKEKTFIYDPYGLGGTLRVQQPMNDESGVYWSLKLTDKYHNKLVSVEEI